MQQTELENARLEMRQRSGIDNNQVPHPTQVHSGPVVFCLDVYTLSALPFVYS